MTRWFFVALITAFAAMSGPRVTNIGTVVAPESHNVDVPFGGGGCPAHAPCPLPPRAFVDTTYSLPIGGKTWAVHSDADFIAALAGFAAGDVIALDAGKIYTGN